MFNPLWVKYITHMKGYNMSIKKMLPASNEVYKPKEQTMKFEPTSEQIEKFKRLPQRVQAMIIDGYLDINDIDMIEEATARAVDETDGYVFTGGIVESSN